MRSKPCPHFLLLPRHREGSSGAGLQAPPCRQPRLAVELSGALGEGGGAAVPAEGGLLQDAEVKRSFRPCSHCSPDLTRIWSYWMKVHITYCKWTYPICMYLYCLWLIRIDFYGNRLCPEEKLFEQGIHIDLVFFLCVFLFFLGCSVSQKIKLDTVWICWKPRPQMWIEQLQCLSKL